MRNKILDAAGELFILKGYDNTSTKDIMEKVGIARGTLYNHFKSKEDVLDGVIKRIVETRINMASEIASNKSIPVLNRLTMTMLAMQADTSLESEMLEQMHKPQNALMHQKSQDMILKGIVPILTSIIDEGMSQGLFDTKYPKEAIEMIMLYANVMFDDIEVVDEATKMQRMQSYIYNIERLLGTEENALNECIMQIFLGNGDN